MHGDGVQPLYQLSLETHSAWPRLEDAAHGQVHTDRLPFPLASVLSHSYTSVLAGQNPYLLIRKHSERKSLPQFFFMEVVLG